jgi:hypothetical protein
MPAVRISTQKSWETITKNRFASITTGIDAGSTKSVLTICLYLLRHS